MKIIDRKVLRGRNIYSHKPVIMMTVDLGINSGIETKDIKGFNERLLAAFPGLKKHTCSLGYEGGFAERLNNGTYLAHVLEHLILEMQNILGFNVKYGKTVAKNQKQDLIVYEYENEECAVECSVDAVDIISCFTADEYIRIDRIFERLRQIKEGTQPGLSTSAILCEAKNRYIPVTRLNGGNLFRLGYGKYGKLIQATLTENTSCISADICSDKGLTKALLKDVGIPVPEGCIAGDPYLAVDAAKEMGFPVAVKPLDANQGKGVSTNLITEGQVRDA